MDKKRGSGPIKKQSNVYYLNGKRVRGNDNLIQSPDSFAVRPDYFARYRFNIEELIEFLNKSSGVLYTSVPFLFQCLDDLGHWSYVRQSEIFKFTSDLEDALRDQFNMLERAFQFNGTDILLWSDLRSKSSERQLVQIEESSDNYDQEIIRVKSIQSGATFLVRRDELDFWNANGSTLPVDYLGEVIDWSRDQFWLKKLNDFKLKMIQEGFKFNFSSRESDLVDQRQHVVNEIIKYFTLQEGDIVQSLRGLGVLACGNGGVAQSSLVQAMALQAFGQIFGVSSRLWGKVDENYEVNPAFVTINVSESRNILNLANAQSMLLDHSCRPIQRTQNEVMRRVMARGPFGRHESLGLSLGMPQSMEEKFVSDDETSLKNE